jgi:flagellar hook-associated protein 1 FlgK
MSGFSSLNVGAQALFAAQRALDVTGQNVSNANTEGYSRQRVQQSARGAAAMPVMFARSDAAAGGVDILGTQRIRDGFLESRAHQEHATYAGLGALSGTYADIEATFGEPSKTGLQSQLSSFWNAWSTVANDPGGSGPRSLLLEQADTLADTVNAFSTQLTQQWSASREQVASTVADVNSMTAEVARLNAAVRSATLNGGAPNELADQRDLLVTRIAEATGATATPDEGGVVNLTLGGRTLVNGIHSQQLQAVGPTSYPATIGTVGVSWLVGDQPATIDSGALSGLLTAVNTTIPGTMSDLDSVAASLADAVNGQQAKGFDRNGRAGGAIFGGTTAATLRAVLTDPAGVAASAKAPPALDGGNALSMGQLATSATGPDTLFRDMTVRLGVQAQSIQRRTEAQSAVTDRVDSARDSVSAVSIDEEMTNLVAFQHAYSAAAKYVSAIDSTLDTLINMVR